DWHEGDDTFDISNNVVDESKVVVNGLGSYYEGDPTKIVRTASTDPNYFFGNQSKAPLNTWDFDYVWGAHASDYPTFLAGPAVVDLQSAENNSAIRIVQKGCDSIDTSSSTKESSLTVQDPAYSYPTGLIGFSLSGCDSTVAIRATFSGSFDLSKTVIRKYNSVNHSFTMLTAANSGLVMSTGSLNGNPALRVDYNIADNGPLDEDATVGKIKDPSGPALIVTSVPNTGLFSN
ncbi:MAG: choice-of-anchor U domain-containing protein, partial [Candidatus Saccharibacteria bacterium]